MLKISRHEPGNQTVTLRLEGQVIGPWVEELKHICQPLLKRGLRLNLDLTDVGFVDQPGIATLTQLATDGTSLLNASPFVEKQLQTGALG